MSWLELIPIQTLYGIAVNLIEMLILHIVGKDRT